MNTNSVAHAIATIEAEARPWTESFIPTRYPYTYAYDYMRSHARHFGLTDRRSDGQPWSRADCAQITRIDFGDDKEVVCRMLADAYLREHGIKPHVRETCTEQHAVPTPSCPLPDECAHPSHGNV